MRLAAFEATWLDTARDGMNRSDYVRQLIRRDAEERGLT